MSERERSEGTGRQSTADGRSVLYTIVCGSPAARDVGTLVAMAQRSGWTVCVVATPSAVPFIDVAALEAQTGYPVRSRYKHPLEPDVLPPADAMIVAPATCNTVNKWSAGISDTLPLGLLVEAIGLGLPLVAMPFTNRAQAAHPAVGESIDRLRSWGVTVLFGDDVVPLHEPRAGDEPGRGLPWHLTLDALHERIDPHSHSAARTR